jgi:hypothetical protein
MIGVYGKFQISLIYRRDRFIFHFSRFQNRSLYRFWSENIELRTDGKSVCRHGGAANNSNYEKISLFMLLAFWGFLFVFDFEALSFLALLVVRVPAHVIYL